MIKTLCPKDYCDYTTAGNEYIAKVEEMLARKVKLRRRLDEKVKEHNASVVKAGAELHRLQTNVATMLKKYHCNSNQSAKSGRKSGDIARKWPAQVCT